MTQNPYAGTGFDDAIGEPPRTSVTAILSLVLSFLGCCTPIGILAALLGIFSIVGISKSEGRVTGKGLAIAGIIVGLVTGALGIGAYLGAGVVYDKVFIGLTDPVMTEIEAGDPTAVRALLGPNVTISDEQIIQFRDAYQSQLGAYQGVPEGWMEYIQALKDPAIGPDVNANSSGGNVIPMPGIFANSTALMMVHFDPNAPAPSGMPACTDILILLPDGTAIRLTDPVPETPEDGG